MRPKSILLLTLALGCGLVASIGISQVLEHRGVQPSGNGETQGIFIAMLDIASHETLTPQNIKFEEWPKDKIQPGAITKLEDIEGKRTKVRLFAGEQILSGRLIGAGEVDSASGQIPKGYRVVSVRVDAVSGGSSLILPGDRVDLLVYMTKNPGNGVDETCTKTVLQDVSVFAADTITNAQRKSDKDEPVITAKTISLLVTPEQAELVTMASELGSIRLVMRGPEDSGQSESTGKSVGDLFERGSGSKGDRVAEEQKRNDTGGDDIVKIIEKHVAPDSPTLGNSQPAGPWRMVLMEGSALREVEIEANGVTYTTDTSNPPAEEPTIAPADVPVAGVPEETNAKEANQESP